MTHLNWNKPLPEDRKVISENPVLNDSNKKFGNIKDKFFFVTVNETEDKYGPRERSYVLLIRNEGHNYIRYAIKVSNVPSTGFLKKGINIW